MRPTWVKVLFLLLDAVFSAPQFGRSDNYHEDTTQDGDDKDSPKKKPKTKDLDDLKKEVPLVSS